LSLIKKEVIIQFEIKELLLEGCAMLNKLLPIALVLAFSLQAGATTISLTAEGTTINATPGSTVHLTISSNADGVNNFAFAFFDCIIAVTGGDVITSAISTVDAHVYGWDATLSFDPDGLGTESVEIACGNFLAPLIAIIGYVDVAYTGGTQVVGIEPGYSFGGGGGHNHDIMGYPLIFSTGVVTIVPEPATLLLLTLGALLLRKRH
jgi:hypothetical protein